MQVEGKLNLEKNKCMAARNLAYGVDAINRIHRNTNNGVFFLPLWILFEFRHILHFYVNIINK